MIIPKAIVGIAGGTCSGKTSVANRAAEIVGRDQVIIIAQDNYYRDLNEVSPEERSRFNFDRPEAFDHELLLHHLRELRDGNAVDVPTYDYVNHTRGEDVIHLEPAPLIILEGILVLYQREIRKALDFHVFVDEEADVRLARRITRDEVERGRSAQGVLLQYMETVRPAHRQFIEPSKVYADIIIPRGGENHAAIEILANHLKTLLET